jgi:hypothetical protein
MISRRYLDPSYTATTMSYAIGELRPVATTSPNPRLNVRSNAASHMFSHRLSTPKPLARERAAGLVPTVRPPVDIAHKRGTLPVSLVHVRWWSAFGECSPADEQGTPVQLRDGPAAVTRPIRSDVSRYAIARRGSLQRAGLGEKAPSGRAWKSEDLPPHNKLLAPARDGPVA